MPGVLGLGESDANVAALNGHSATKSRAHGSGALGSAAFRDWYVTCSDQGMRQFFVWVLSCWLLACAGTQPSPNVRRPNIPEVYTADGRVLGVERPLPEDPATNVHLIFQSQDEEPVRVELGPGWYVDEGKVHFDPKDDISVEGRREVRNGKPVIVARSVRKGSTTLRLRDEEARPLWSH